jgi:hydroxyacyl-ACP dehydratase HTD2-like protein with hotdog domain
MRTLPKIAMAAAVLVAKPLAAHHSFAVYFDPNDQVTLQGTVTAFRFTNPHGTLVLNVDGTEWRAETNAPVVLQRRGWRRDSLRPGQQVTVTGWRARDGRHYMRLMEARDSEGRMIGTARFGQYDG